MLTNKISLVNHESKMLGENNRLTKKIEQKRHHYSPPPPLPPLSAATTNRSKLAQGKKHRKYQRVISSCVSMIQLDSCVMNQALPDNSPPSPIHAHICKSRARAIRISLFIYVLTMQAANSRILIISSKTFFSCLYNASNKYIYTCYQNSRNSDIFNLDFKL